MNDNTFKVGDLTVKLTPDSNPENPRQDFEHFGRMLCSHGRYRLGDEKRTTPEEVREVMEREDVVKLPVYMYDHSGITIRTTPFSCPWDSGIVGVIYCTFEDVVKEFGEDNAENRAKAEKILIVEVEAYDQYLRGDVWYYVVENEDGLHLDSCGGFFGYDYAREQAVDSANSINARLATDYAI